MNVLVRISSCLCLLVLCSVFSVAQDKFEISTDPPPPMAKLPIVKEVGKAKILYNERRNKTIIQTASLQVQGDWRNGITLRAGFDVTGKDIAKPSTITLTFFSAASDRTYADNRTLKIFLDGKEVLSSVAHYMSGNTNGEVYLITATQEVTYEMFLRLINSKSVKMQIGPTEFELKESDLAALRDLKKIIE